MGVRVELELGGSIVRVELGVDEMEVGGWVAGKVVGGTKREGGVGVTLRVE